MILRRKLGDILSASRRKDLDRKWETTQAAPELEPLPKGQYRCLVVGGELSTARTTGTLSYKLTLEVVEGEHAGRRLWYDIWLSDNAMAIAKRELAKLHITEPDQLDRPLPEGFIVSVSVALRTNDDGTQFNRVQRFAVVAFEPPAPDPFAPPTRAVRDGAVAAPTACGDGVDAATTGGGGVLKPAEPTPPGNPKPAVRKRRR